MIRKPRFKRSRHDTRAAHNPDSSQRHDAEGTMADADVSRIPLGRKVLMTLIAIGIIGVFVILTNIILGMNEKPEEKKRPFTPLAVIADYAQSESVQLNVDTQGETRPQIEIDLVPQVGGKIVYVSPNFVEGGVFNKGEVLVRIEAADFEVAVIQAEANVANAEQVLVREQAEGEIARQDWEELGTGEPTALTLRKPQQQQAEASVLAAKAQLDAAKLQLTRTEVRAPFSGRVQSKSSDIGQFVAPGSRLGRIFSKNVIEVRLPLSDDQLSKLDLPVAFVAKNRAEGKPVTLTANVAGKSQIWNGRIMRTGSAYDTQTRALFAIVEVFDPYGEGASEDGTPLAPGLFVNASIPGKEFSEIITFPRDGLRPDDEVYVVNDKGKAEIRKVSVLDTNENRAMLTGGVKVGEMVVLSPMERSRVTMTLKVLNANDPTEVLVDPPAPPGMQSADEKKEKGSEGDVKSRPLKKGDAVKEDPDDAEANAVSGKGEQE